MNTAINSNNTDNIYSKRYEMLQHYKKEIADKKWTKLNLLLVGFKEIPQIEYKDLTLKYMEDNLYTCKGGAIVARNVHLHENKFDSTFLAEVDSMSAIKSTDTLVVRVDLQPESSNVEDICTSDYKMMKGDEILKCWEKGGCQYVFDKQLNETEKA
ncbi:hypothetical protein AKO1_014223, partial [Acrasis kona]